MNQPSESFKLVVTAECGDKVIGTVS